MPDREKVVKGLHDLRRYLEDKEWSDNRVDRRTAKVYWQTVTDALALLKEQEAVKPKSKSRHGEYPQIVHRCGNCNAVLCRYYKYCPTCGRLVKWDA